MFFLQYMVIFHACYELSTLLTNGLTSLFSYMGHRFAGKYWIYGDMYRVTLTYWRCLNSLPVAMCVRVSTKWLDFSLTKSNWNVLVLVIVTSTSRQSPAICSRHKQRKQQSSALPFVGKFHRWPGRWITAQSINHADSVFVSWRHGTAFMLCEYLF